MKNKEKELFQMGEVTKALGLTRRILINYENLGLVLPAVKNENRGFRYYSAENIVHIRLIRSLQNLGLSLAEIKSYFDNTRNLDEQINRLIILRTQLEQHIAQLQLRQSNENIPEIMHVTLPGFTAYCRNFHELNISNKTSALRATYIDALKHYTADVENKMCTFVSTASESDGIYAIPVASESTGDCIKKFPRAAAICIYYRGAYEGLPAVHSRLMQYARDNGMTPHGYFRNIYMEGPPTYGSNKESYVTQVALPIKFISTEKDK